jgi:hypothetical protein
MEDHGFLAVSSKGNIKIAYSQSDDPAEYCLKEFQRENPVNKVGEKECTFAGICPEGDGQGLELGINRGRISG